ncbi:hypothetical protein B0192_11415 [Leptospira interrogans serovar Australis]|nr:hypothetical protein B0192_11415 [Leptospira interrogans serovar Australis]
MRRFVNCCYGIFQQLYYTFRDVFLGGLIVAGFSFYIYLEVFVCKIFRKQKIFLTFLFGFYSKFFNHLFKTCFHL